MNNEMEQNPRLRKLLRLLLESNDWFTGNELALKIGITDRTIRNDMMLLKEIMFRYQARIDAIKGKGYRLVVDDRSQLDSLLNSNERSTFLKIAA